MTVYASGGKLVKEYDPVASVVAVTPPPVTVAFGIATLEDASVIFPTIAPVAAAFVSATLTVVVAPAVTDTEVDEFE